MALDEGLEALEPAGQCRGDQAGVVHGGLAHAPRTSMPEERMRGGAESPGAPRLRHPLHVLSE